jgi:hypothetical protein
MNVSKKNAVLHPKMNNSPGARAKSIKIETTNYAPTKAKSKNPFLTQCTMMTFLGGIPG